MGEKEQGTAQRVTAPRDVMTGQSSGRSIPENSIEAGDVDGDSPLESSVKSSKSNSSERQASGVLSTDTDQPNDLDDDGDGDGTLDEGPLSVLKTKTKSNQSNDRLGHEDDPAAVDDDGDGTLDEGPVFVLKNKTKSNQSNDRLGQEEVPDGSGAAKSGPIRIDSTPARGASDSSAGGGGNNG